jgi:hypothetical protein
VSVSYRLFNCNLPSFHRIWGLTECVRNLQSRLVRLTPTPPAGCPQTWTPSPPATPPHPPPPPPPPAIPRHKWGLYRIGKQHQLSATSGPSDQSRIKKLRLNGCQSVRRGRAFLSLRTDVRAKRSCERVTNYCWHQRQCGAAGVHLGQCRHISMSKLGSINTSAS